ncbi:hypothetical protein AF332_27820 [Sporosarcina globispora]|uniref:Uncharacterized protein n=1 Tax=Sporosarcina globispora TaxID=1459 RepID=A0A0M0G175_SPOGL|nr:hypothetical protein [Sporosarcina globispora]KON83555.1 hypothetical protein AF332_27820 [Sporosarcina globispora]
MSRLIMMEVAMKEELPELYDIYFGGNILLHYEDVKNEKDIPFIVVGMTDGVGEAGAIEFLRGCEQFKVYHKHLFGVEVKSFVTVADKFKQVDNWWDHFHPNGIYR